MAMWRFPAGSSYNLENVDQQTGAAIENIIKSTFSPRLVGQGHDARGLRHNNVHLRSIHKIKNQRLLQAYEQHKLDLQLKHDYCEPIPNIPQSVEDFKTADRDSRINEYYLFHGTDEDSVKSIAETGFKPEITDPNGLYGQGIYFAEKFTKADQYTDEKYHRDPAGTDLTVLICKVLLGEAFNCHKNDAEKWTHPPCRNCEEEDCECGYENWYDSVLGTGRGMLFREFVVYEGSQCYPEYIVTYRRLGKRVPRENYWGGNQAASMSGYGW